MKNRYIMTYERYSSRKKKIWDELLKIKEKRDFKSVKTEPEPVNNPDMILPTAKDGSSL